MKSEKRTMNNEKRKAKSEKCAEGIPSGKSENAPPVHPVGESVYRIEPEAKA
jgi:hypothetical protein